MFTSARFIWRVENPFMKSNNNNKKYVPMSSSAEVKRCRLLRRAVGLTAPCSRCSASSPTAADVTDWGYQSWDKIGRTGTAFGLPVRIHFSLLHSPTQLILVKYIMFLHIFHNHVSSAGPQIASTHTGDTYHWTASFNSRDGNQPHNRSDVKLQHSPLTDHASQPFPFSVRSPQVYPVLSSGVQFTNCYR